MTYANGMGLLRWRRWRYVVLVLGITMAASGCGARAGAHAVFSVSPATALFDAPVTVSISGLPPGATTTVTAAATDHSGLSWVSRAQFTASAAGAVSLSQASVGGSYTGRACSCSAVPRAASVPA